MIASINDIREDFENCEVTLTMSQENAIKVLHFANFGEETIEAINEVYKGNKQEIDLKMDNLEDMKIQLGVSGKKTSNLIVV